MSDIRAIPVAEPFGGDATCDKCGVIAHIDTMYEEVLTKDSHGDNVIRRFMECPSCHTRYTTDITSRRMRRKIEQRNKLAAEISHEAVELYKKYSR